MEVDSEKVVLNCAKLDDKLRHAIGHAHSREDPGNITLHKVRMDAVIQSQPRTAVA